MSVLIDKALALVLPEVKASAVCKTLYKCAPAGYFKRVCCSSSGDNCSPWERISPICPV
ncbi:hypothetical protein [Nonomuraea mesophila]|uniref:hypothetical protein n=1 Tax=Nonomuraea mesophila TaxID=2530382 RepID=UPI00140AF50B|nr:hypothetical protein [Nonomuraea mesophila]